MKQDQREKSRREKEYVSEKEKEEKEYYTEEKEAEKELFERIIEEKFKEEYKKMQKVPGLEEEIKKEAQEVKKLKKQGKVSRLLKLAEEKGLFFAIAVARKMETPYILDILHDILAQNEFYKKFLKE